MIRGRGWLLAAVAVVAALAVAGSLVTPTGRVARAARGAVAPVVASGLVCPSVSGGSGGRTTDMTVAHVTAGPAPLAAYTPVLGTGRAFRPVPMTLKPSAVVRKSTAAGAASVTAAGPGAGGVVASQGWLTPGGLSRGLTDLTCTPPSTDWWFAGAQMAGSGSPTCSSWSTRPTLRPTSRSAFWVEPRTTQPAEHQRDHRGLRTPCRSTTSPTTRPTSPGVAVHVHANSGTVAAAIVEDLESCGEQVRWAATGWGRERRSDPLHGGDRVHARLDLRPARPGEPGRERRDRVAADRDTNRTSCPPVTRASSCRPATRRASTCREQSPVRPPPRS